MTKRFENDEVLGLTVLALGHGEHDAPPEVALDFDSVDVDFVQLDRAVVFLLRDGHIVRSFAFRILMLPSRDFHKSWMTPREEEGENPYEQEPD